MSNDNYNNWIRQAMEHGMSPFEASQMPQAKAAHEADRAADARVRESAKKGDFLSAFVQNRSKEGGPLGFHDQEEMLAAMADPLYETSGEYRSAVAEILTYTPAEVVGVSATGIAQDGQVIEMGRQRSDVATTDSMLKNAYRDYVIEEMGKLDLGSAKGRYEYMQYLADPKNAEAIAYMEGLVTSDEQATQTTMLNLKASGQVQRYVTPVSNAIDQPEGTVITEEQS